MAAAPANPAVRTARDAWCATSARAAESRRATEEEEVVSVLEERVVARPAFRCPGDVPRPAQSDERSVRIGEMMDECLHRLALRACHRAALGDHRRGRTPRTNPALVGAGRGGDDVEQIVREVPPDPGREAQPVMP